MLDMLCGSFSSFLQSFNKSVKELLQCWKHPTLQNNIFLIKTLLYSNQKLKTPLEAEA